MAAISEVRPCCFTNGYRCATAAGTLFVLQKDASPKERLLDAVNSNKADDQRIEQLVEQLQSFSPEKRPASSAKTQGKWKLLWSMQVHSAACLAMLHCSAAID